MKNLLSAKLGLLLFILTLTGLEGFSQSVGHTVIRLYKGVAPGSEDWNWSESETPHGPQHVAYNITVPTLTVFEADKSIATGKAVIVCPRGLLLFIYR
jgi:hypothetical protein